MIHDEQRSTRIASLRIWDTGESMFKIWLSEIMISKMIKKSLEP